MSDNIVKFPKSKLIIKAEETLKRLFSEREREMMETFSHKYDFVLKSKIKNKVDEKMDKILKKISRLNRAGNIKYFALPPSFKFVMKDSHPESEVDTEVDTNQNLLSTEEIEYALRYCLLASNYF